MSKVVDSVKEEALVSDGYERVKGELAALPADELQQLNVDVQTATRTILGALPEMRLLRERLVKELPAFDIAAFDKLEDYAQALRYAQSGFQIATQPVDGFDELVTVGEELRDRLRADANALAHYKLFDGGQLKNLKGGLGANNLAEDLELLSRAMLANWEKIEGKALTSLEDVQTASRIGLRLTRMIGLREQGPARLAAASELRLRAFTLVLRTYEEAREAIRYLRRREDDLEDIAPTLYPGRPKRRVSPATDSTDVPPGTVTTAPATVTTAPATGASSPPAVATTPAATGAAAARGGASKDPFMPSA